ncbi:GAF domain-containing protein [bacterium]|nr:GAF domain-containing protein [bacterium]
MKSENKVTIPVDVYQTVFESIELDELSENIFSVLYDAFPRTALITLYLPDYETNVPKRFRIQSYAGLNMVAFDTAIGETLATMVADTGQALFSGRLNEDFTLAVDELADLRLSSYAGLPLRLESDGYAVLELYAVEKDTYTRQEKQHLLALADVFARALSHATLYDRASGRAKRFVGISRAITLSRHLSTIDEVLRDIAKVLVQSLGFDHAWIGLLNDEKNCIEGKTGFGRLIKKKHIYLVHDIFTDSDNPVTEAFLTQQPVVSLFGTEKRMQKKVEEWLLKTETGSYGFVPIMKGEETLGIIGAFLCAAQSFNTEDVKTLTSIAEQAAIAIENAELYEQIKKSEKSYRTLFESAGTCLAIIDNDYVIELVNKAFLALSGCEYDDLVRKKRFIDFLCSPDAGESESVKELLQPQNSWEGEFYTSMGDIRQVHFTIASIPDSDQILISLIDMTRERELERRLYRSEELASIGELSAGIAHEIRNPLAAITTSVSLLKDEPELSDIGRELLDVVKEESDHLTVIVNDFLRFARPQTPNMREANINKLLADVIRKTSDLFDKNIKINTEFDEIPMAAIDRHQIQQVITNLILNGVDACEVGGTLTVTSKLKKVNKTPHVEICIRDNGNGIPQENINKIFQPFFSTKDKGTGMGLAICQRIIDGHDGEIIVDSTIGEGTSFNVIFPVRKEQTK